MPANYHRLTMLLVNNTETHTYTHKMMLISIIYSFCLLYVENFIKFEQSEDKICFALVNLRKLILTLKFQASDKF